MRRIPNLLFIGSALVCTILAIVYYYALVRPVKAIGGSGVIIKMSFKGASTYSQQPSGSNRSFTIPIEISIAESYIFEIQLDKTAESARFSQNSIASQDFKTGQRVLIEYKERGIPLLWRRINVMDMKPAI